VFHILLRLEYVFIHLQFSSLLGVLTPLISYCFYHVRCVTLEAEIRKCVSVLDLAAAVKK
jgi:hypothetical protein